MRRLALFAAVGLGFGWFLACNPPITGAPCNNQGECPTGQVCTPGRTCEPPGGLGGAGGAGGAGGSGGSGGSGGGGGLKADGEVCGQAAECLSNVCKDYFTDGDGDGHGKLTAGKRCGATAPAGTSELNDDCCDTDDKVFPGQVNYYSTARASTCGAPSYDYNCNNTDDPEPLATTNCVPNPMCHQCAAGIGWAKPSIPPCGMEDDQVISVGGDAGTPPCNYTQNVIQRRAARCR